MLGVVRAPHAAAGQPDGGGGSALQDSGSRLGLRSGFQDTQGAGWLPAAAYTASLQAPGAAIDPEAGLGLHSESGLNEYSMDSNFVGFPGANPSSALPALPAPALPVTYACGPGGGAVAARDLAALPAPLVLAPPGARPAAAVPGLAALPAPPVLAQPTAPQWPQNLPTGITARPAEPSLAPLPVPLVLAPPAALFWPLDLPKQSHAPPAACSRAALPAPPVLAPPAAPVRPLDLPIGKKAARRAAAAARRASAGTDGGGGALGWAGSEFAVPAPGQGATPGQGQGLLSRAAAAAPRAPAQSTGPLGMRTLQGRNLDPGRLQLPAVRAAGAPAGEATAAKLSWEAWLDEEGPTGSESVAGFLAAGRVPASAVLGGGRGKRRKVAGRGTCDMRHS